MDNERIQAIEECVCAALYYIYRQAGCPQGYTLEQFNLWVDLQRGHWRNFTLPTTLKMLDADNNKD